MTVEHWILPVTENLGQAHSHSDSCLLLDGGVVPAPSAQGRHEV